MGLVEQLRLSPELDVCAVTTEDNSVGDKKLAGLEVASEVSEGDRERVQRVAGIGGRKRGNPAES